MPPRIFSSSGQHRVGFVKRWQFSEPEARLAGGVEQLLLPSRTSRWCGIVKEQDLRVLGG